MSKSRNKNRSEVEFLRGRIRRLEAQLKYYKKRANFFEAETEEIIEEVEEVTAERCPQCRRGIVSIYDFKFATLAKCSSCDYERRQKK